MITLEQKIGRNKLVAQIPGYRVSQLEGAGIPKDEVIQTVFAKYMINLMQSTPCLVAKVVNAMQKTKPLYFFASDGIVKDNVWYYQDNFWQEPVLSLLAEKEYSAAVLCVCNCTKNGRKGIRLPNQGYPVIYPLEKISVEDAKLHPEMFTVSPDDNVPLSAQTHKEILTPFYMSMKKSLLPGVTIRLSPDLQDLDAIYT
jgi:hypothetical protein